MTTEERIKQVQHHEQCDSRFASVCGDSQRCSCGLDWLLAELDAARAERDNAIDENIRLMNAETEALRAQLAAAQAREQELTETFNERVNWIQVVEARWHSAEAREAKLREALKDVLPQAIHSRHCALRPCRCPIKTARAALAEGEDTK